MIKTIVLLYFLGTLLYAYVMVLSYNSILKESKKITLYDWIIMTIISIIMLINNQYNHIDYTMICSILIVTVLFFLIFREKGRRFFYNVIFICLFAILVDFVISSVLLLVSSINHLLTLLVVLRCTLPSGYA
jgi:hypothetical protein